MALHPGRPAERRSEHVSPARTLAVAAAATLLCTQLGPARAQSLAGMASSSVLVVRVTATNVAAVVDEFDTVDVLQRAPIQSTTVPNCFLTPTTSGTGYGSNSANGAYALFTCGTASSANNDRQIIRIDAGGNVDTSQLYVGYDGYLPRGIASMDGANLFQGDGESTAAAVKYCAFT